MLQPVPVIPLMRGTYKLNSKILQYKLFGYVQFNENIFKMEAFPVIQEVGAKPMILNRTSCILLHFLFLLRILGSTY